MVQIIIQTKFNVNCRNITTIVSFHSPCIPYTVFLAGTVKPALAVTRLSRGPALAVEIPWSQLFSTFYEANLPA